MKYVELHCHSNFSFLDGASSTDEIVDRASELGYDSLALTDHNGLYGAVRFNKRVLERGIKPVFGCEISLENDHSLILLVKNETGYSNLCQLLSVAHLANRKGEAKTTFEKLAEYSRGLICLSGSLRGEIPSMILNNQLKRAEKIAGKYRDLFKDNFYIEMQHHNLPIHEILCNELSRLSKRLNLPLVVTNNVRYARPEGRKLQDILTCIKNHTTLDEARHLLYPNAQRYLKSSQEMMKRFARWPQAIENSQIISQRCNFSLSSVQYSLPEFPVPDGETGSSYLRKLVYRGATERYKFLTDKITTQIEHELQTIMKLALEGYFLIVWDIARFCRDDAILCQGRGSAANSAVCYCLGITAVDPIGLKLLFERFVSESRSEPPDIDIDIASNRREEVIQYVYDRYSRENAAMVCEIISYRGRSSVRDVGKALGFSLDEVNKLAKLMDHFSDGNEMTVRIKESGLDPKNNRVEHLIDLCRQIKGFPRHLGIHVGGMVITRNPIGTVVPVENATMPGRTVIQWDKDDVAEVGLVKIDLLGLGMLTLIDYALKLIKKTRGVEINTARLSYDDPRVYELITKAETVGVFQVESRAQMNTLPRSRPNCFYDLVVEVALIRPGPIQGNMVHPYLRRRNNEEEISYSHPSLKPILERTLGIPLFQEQGMQVAVAVAGFSPDEADQLRRAMGHKRSHDRMAELGDRLINGMMQRGITLEEAQKIFRQLAAFADFGFAESHAASFALLVYLSAYLKVYYPEEFYCSLLNAQPMGFYSVSTIVYEAKRRGVKILPVDLFQSHYDSTVQKNAVRLGFHQIKSIGKVVGEIIETRRKNRKFESLHDFVFRSGLQKDSLEQLANVGAFDSMGLSRREALWQVMALLNRREDELNLTAQESTGLLPEMTIIEEVASDFRGMSLSTGPHPMILVREKLNLMGVLRSVDLQSQPNQKMIHVAGIVVIRQRPRTAKGFMFLTLEDETGFSNIVIKPNLLEMNRNLLVGSDAVIVRGLLEKKDGVVNVIGRQFKSLEVSKNEIKIKSRDFK